MNYQVASTTAEQHSKEWGVRMAVIKITEHTFSFKRESEVTPTDDVVISYPLPEKKPTFLSRIFGGK